MYKLSIPVFLSILLTACGGGGGSSELNTQNNSVSTSVITPKEFAYETERSIGISVSLKLNTSSQQKQILFYETQKTVTTPVGDQLIFDDLLTEGVTDTNGDYTTKVKLGKHIESIWVVIPALSYENQVSIVDDVISVNIIEGL